MLEPPPPRDAQASLLAFAASFPPPWHVWGLLDPAGGAGGSRGMLQPLLRGQAWAMVPCP